MSQVNGYRTLLSVALIVASLCWCAPAAEGAPPAPSAAAAPAVPPAARVAEVQVRGHVKMTVNAVLEQVRTRAGDTYDPAIAQGDVQRLLNTGRFTTVTVEKADGPQGVILTFVVAERPTISRLVIQGNKAFQYAALAGETGLSAGSALGRDAAEAGAQAILKKYHAEGYPFATVTLDANAFTERQEVIYTIVEGQQPTIRRVRFQGNGHFGSLRLMGEVGTMARFWPFTKGRLDLDQLDHDVTAIRNLYVEEGFLDAEVGYRPLDYSDDKKTVRVTFTIVEGPRYRVNKVVFQGNQVFSGETLAGRLLLKQGEFFTAVSLRRDLKKLQDTYGELGYLQARVDFRKQYLDPQAPLPEWAKRLGGQVALVNLLFRIEEEDPYRVGQVLIRGNTITQARVIRRELRFYPEQYYNTVAVAESKKRLEETRLFEKVNITPEGKAEGVRNALVEVKEGKTADFIIGVGVSSRDGVLGNISLTQRNFDPLAWPNSQRRIDRGQAWKGAGQTLSITLEPGLDVMRFSINWFEPYLMDQPYSLGLRAFLFDRPREDYRETRIGAVASVGHMFKNRWYGELAGRVEDVHIGDLDFDAPPEANEVRGDNILLGLKGTIARNRTDSRWMPSTGDSIRFSYEQVVGDFTFGRATLDYHIYRTVYTDALERKHILAARASVGQIFGEAPLFEKFYGGGLGSVRGFRYRGISPRSAGTDKPIGGDFLVFAGAEYSAPLVADFIRGVVFLDTGTVEKDFGVTTYRASVGFGVRWVIPFFGPIPMSLDFGFPIAKDRQDDTQILSFSLGWTF